MIEGILSILFFAALVYFAFGRGGSKPNSRSEQAHDTTGTSTYGGGPGNNPGGY